MMRIGYTQSCRTAADSCQSSAADSGTMGGSHSVIPPEKLEYWQGKTFFTQQEILSVYKRFQKMKESDENPKEYSNEVICMAAVIKGVPELEHNPFARRICEVFSSADAKAHEPERGSLTFEDFLDMMSVFSDSAPKVVKMEQAFKLYDIDGDGVISGPDLREVMKLLTKQPEDQDSSSEKPLPDETIDEFIRNVFAETDVKQYDIKDRSTGISSPQFQIIMSKSPDFISTFRIRP